MEIRHKATVTTGAKCRERAMLTSFDGPHAVGGGVRLHHEILYENPVIFEKAGSGQRTHEIKNPDTIFCWVLVAEIHCFVAALASMSKKMRLEDNGETIVESFVHPSDVALPFPNRIVLHRNALLEHCVSLARHEHRLGARCKACGIERLLVTNFATALVNVHRATATRHGLPACGKRGRRRRVSRKRRRRGVILAEKSLDGVLQTIVGGQQLVGQCLIRDGGYVLGLHPERNGISFVPAKDRC